ncbi:MAG: SufD family Fe-S cluster assembly protein [Euryarchaeota archaeon]|nr:SufD family Fe-S cluster assembly protein [Euryarchaeota archaeon]
MHQLEELMRSFGESGGDRSILANKDIAHLVAGGHRILSMRAVEGLEVKAKETPKGISVKVRVMAAIKNPVHLCFGVIHKKGIQEIKMDVVFEAGASASFIAHCIFPKAEKVRHIMDASIRIGENAQMRYSEIHYHGPFGGIEVIPKAHVIVGKNGRFSADFSLVNGRVGKLWIDYAVDVGENAVSELTTRIFGHGNDIINIKEKIVLSGENSKGLIKARVAIEDRAQAEVTGITEGNAKGARGHVDCLEIVKDNAIARAIPIVNVSHALAKVTHEAAIGSVDKRQLETLMAHGLSPEEAVDVIVRGILR